MQLFYSTIILFLLISTSVGSIFNTPCKILCQKGYVQCYNNYITNEEVYSFGFCGTELDGCLLRCSHPRTFQPRTVEPGYNVEIPASRSRDNYQNLKSQNQQQQSNNIQKDCKENSSQATVN
ncbi:hypothetical protein DICPUDRAFT_76372 [Dictyostelium purpureum]|uniref:Uncharacterized protein n=1 Tax=Dictyostelium purpureum TaxID=5786 RepID=F0ZDE9_DICPU|nr:uncharacterized protein DICPUDRAFT_76372 [Dictyostelium purpureum]EGC38030.1 hypothetical protein DICPUDRAFT_76372 [Dictyostelium purpureum]|eukprot:XP_003285431.1 hypothetical protein DICPUDRAFT_76372 [Dictyostelium purpureum]